MTKRRAFSLFLALMLIALVVSGCAPVQNADGTYSAPSWIAWLSKPLALLIDLVYTKVLTPMNLASYGLAIILVTILIRLLVYPLTKKQMESMKKMQEIQPKMKELQEKYGKDRNKMAEKQMELYRQEGVNPAGGCLPLLIQMPILFAFYYALLSLGPKLNQHFLWIPSLAKPGYREGMAWLAPFNFQHLLSSDVWPYLVLPVLYILSQFVLQRMSQAANAATPGSSSANSMMMLMPVMFGYITLIVPSGLTLYWFTSNVLQIIQQGLTTGWSGLSFGKAAEPAPARKSASSSTTTALVRETVTTSTPEDEPLSAGRRRKMRKKKR